MTDGYRSHDRAYLATLQRKRRAGMVRIDYMPSNDALAAIDAKRGPDYPPNTNGGVLDAIVTEWAELTGINKRKVGKVRAAKSPARTGITRTVRAGAKDSDRRATTARVRCGAKRRRDGQPCEALSVPGKRRCKWHGGCSTGPRTPEGRARALARLCGANCEECSSHQKMRRECNRRVHRHREALTEGFGLSPH